MQGGLTPTADEYSAMAYFEDLSLVPTREALPPGFAGAPVDAVVGTRRVPRRRARTLEERRLRRVGIIWSLLFLNVLGSPAGGVLRIPHSIGQALSQLPLVAALLLALSVNRRVVVRPNLFLGLYTVLGVTTLMMSVRFIGLRHHLQGFSTARVPGRALAPHPLVGPARRHSAP